MLRRAAAAAAATAAVAGAAPTPGNITEPYAWLHSGAYTGSPAPASVDPLVRFQWDADAPYQAMQVYAALPAWVAAAPAAAASGLDTLTFGPYGAGAAVVTGNVSLMVSFGVELAGWLEFTFAGGARLPACAGLTATISEYNSPRPGAPLAPVFYAGAGTPGAGAYRLETNKQLYDGLRYAWLYLSFPPGCPAASVPALAGVRAVAQVLPLNYTGAFSSSDPLLDKIWYTGAYATRVNALPGFFGSELLDRGDRSPPFQGDDHVAQAVGLAAFASPPLYELARTMLNFTDSAAHSVHDSNIATYPLMWVLTVIGYYTATGDGGLFAAYAPDVATILDGAIANFQSWDVPADLRWSGWDDRLGSGFVDVDQTPEARRFYWMTTLRAAARFAEAAGKAGAPLAPFATKYAAARGSMLAALRAPGADWWASGGYGLHAAAAAVNSGALTSDEQAGMFGALFNDSAHICSLSNYDSGFLLEALAVMGRLDYGTAMLRLCWGRQLAAGASCWWESTNFYDGMLQDGADQDILPGATTSSCHAWGGHATVWESRYVLGVAPAEPGYAAFAFEPFVGLTSGDPGGSGLLSRVAGRVPSPHGAIVAAAEVAAATAADDNGTAATLTLRLSHPVGTAGAAVLPAELPHDCTVLACGGASLRLGGVRVLSTRTGAARDFTLPPTLSVVESMPAGLRLRADHPLGRLRVEVPPALLPGLGGSGSGDDSDYVVTGAYRAADGASCHAAPAPAAAAASTDAWPYAPFGPPVWPGLLAVDNVTHGGGWVGKYGKDGYLLFGFDAPASRGAPPRDRAALPPYVASVNVSTPSRVRYTPGGAGAGGIPPGAFLADPAGGGAPPALGAAFMGPANNGQLYSLFVDVALPSPAPLRGNPIYSLWVDVNTTTAGRAPAAPAERALRGNNGQQLLAPAPSSYTVTLYVADTTGAGADVADPMDAQSMVLRAEDLVTRSALAPDAMVRHYVPPPAWNGTAPATWNAAGFTGLEAGLYLRVTYNASLRLRLYCASGCYASVSALMFDTA